MANILGIKLSELSPSGTLEKIQKFLKDGEQHYIVTPNPEIILSSHKDEEFFYILNRADLSLADGFGLKIAGRIFGVKIPRITGSDLTFKLLDIAAEQGIKIMVLNWSGGLSSQAEIEAALKEKYPRLAFLVLDVAREKFLKPETIAIINAAAPRIMFSALGFPYQEKVIYHNLEKLPTVKLALGIGGTFDYLTKKIKRPPQSFRWLGLEWFWRLLNIFRFQNKARRLKRIFNATVVFFAKVLKARFINPWLYRPNVACLLYRKNNGHLEIFIVERTDQPGHWQLPQGGTDGQKLEISGARELREESGNNKFITKATFKNLYRYRFAPGPGQLSYRGLNADNKLPVYESRKYKYDYQGQKQGLYIAEFSGSDEDIKINFWDHRAWKWVDAARLIDEVHPNRQASTKIFLEKFNSLNL